MNLYRRIRNFAWRASMFRLPRGPHVTRYYMYDRLRSIAPRLPKIDGSALSISHSENLIDLLELRPNERVYANYPQHNILSLPFQDRSFGYVVSDQVLEHVEGDPQRAVDECHRVLRDGGIAIHTTCFINPIHGAPKDFWRFTPDALQLLHRNWSEIIEIGGWGNLQVWLLDQDGMRYSAIPHAKWHPLHRIAVKNDPLWPIVTWIIAKK